MQDRGSEAARDELPRAALGYGSGEPSFDLT